MISNTTITKQVKEACNSVPFEKVSDLTRNDFERILSSALFGILNSDDFFTGISTELAMSVRRRR